MFDAAYDDLLRAHPMLREMYLRSWLWCGMSRFGKSLAVLSLVLLPALLTGDVAIVLIDATKRGKLAGDFVRLAAYCGRVGRFLLDRVADTARILGYDLGKGSDDPDPLRRANIDELNRESAKRNAVQRRGLADTSKNVLIDEGLDLLFGLLFAQERPAALHWLTESLDPTAPEHVRLAAWCRDRRLARKAVRWALLKGQQWLFQCGPALRAVRGLAEKTAVKLRDGASFDLGAHLDAGGVLVVSGESRGDLSDEAFQGVAEAVIRNVLNHGDRGAERPVLLVIDEGQGAGLIDLNIARACREQAKNKLAIHLVVHHGGAFAPEEVVADVWLNTFHAFCRQGHESARLAAEDWAVRLLDPTRAKLVEERLQQFADGVDTVRTRSVTKHSGERAHESVSEGERTVPRYRLETVKHTTLMPLDEQITDGQKTLMTTGPGEFVFCGDSVTPAPVYVPLPPEPCKDNPRLLGLLEARALERIYARPEYREPRIVEAVCDDETWERYWKLVAEVCPPKAKPAKPAKPSTQAARKLGRPRGKR